MTPETLKRASDFHAGFEYQSAMDRWTKIMLKAGGICFAVFWLLFLSAAFFEVGAGGLPSAYFEYCKKRECSAEAYTIAYTSEFHNLISMARQEQRYAVAYVADPEGTDTWSYPSEGEGDCEDIAIWFMHYLQGKGIPKGLMRFAVGDRPDGRHAWLVLHTSRGWYALDENDFALASEFYVKAEYLESFDCIPGTGCGWRGNTLYPSRTSVVAHTEDRR